MSNRKPQTTKRDRKDDPTPRIRDIYRAWDVAVGALVRRARETNDVPCGPGCAACCWDVALMTTLEVGPIVDRLRRMAPVERAVVKEAIGVWEEGLARVGLRTTTVEPDLRTYHRAKVACPLLDQETNGCRVYEDRPLACRGHYVVNESPAACANRAEKPSVRCLDVSEAMEQAHRVLVGTQRVRTVTVGMLMVPAMLRLAWPLVEDASLRYETWLDGVVKTASQEAEVF